MKTLGKIAVVGLSLMGSMSSGWAQYGGPQYDNGRQDGYDEGQDDSYSPPVRRGFDEREYLRCNPDVRRAVYRGTMPSAIYHYQHYGRREGRQLRC